MPGQDNSKWQQQPILQAPPPLLNAQGLAKSSLSSLLHLMIINEARMSAAGQAEETQSHIHTPMVWNARLSSSYSWYTGVRSQFPNVAWNIKLKINCRNDQTQQHRLYQLPFVLIMINNIFKEWCHLIGIDHQPAANNGAEGSYYSW